MIQQFITGIVAAQIQGQDTDGLVATLANMLDPNNVRDGVPQPYGVEGINTLVEAGREKAKAKIAKAEKKRKAKALEAAQNALRTEAETFQFSLSDTQTETLGVLASKAKVLGATLTVDVDGETVTLSVSGLKAPRGGNNGGGKPAKNQPRPFVSLDSGERIVGSLTDWARENLSESELGEAKHDKNDKLRGGKVLETFLVKGKGEGDDKVGPWIQSDDGESFKGDYAAWEASKDDSSNEG